jgi:hypothetical protein
MPPKLMILLLRYAENYLLACNENKNENNRESDRFRFKSHLISVHKRSTTVIVIQQNDIQNNQRLCSIGVANKQKKVKA